MLQKRIALTRTYSILEPCSRELRLLDRAVNGYLALVQQERSDRRAFPLQILHLQNEVFLCFHR